MSFRSVVKAFIPRKLFRKIEPYGHLGEAVLLNILNGFPARGLKIIGVTGTNGKTSTCFLIHRMMVEAGYNVGLMTTVSYGVGEVVMPQIHHMTNVSVPELMQRLKWMKKQGAKWLVLETTSHALAQHRVWGIPYSVAVMTNVTHEHLDYHGTFESYRDAKRRLFKLANRNKKGLRTGVINADDLSADLFESDIARPLTYGVTKGEIRATDIQATPTGSVFTVKSSSHKDLQLKIKTNLPGSFNVYNSLAAVGVGFALDMEPQQIVKGIAALEAVEGRMESIDVGQDFRVIVDYAVTPDALLNVLQTLRATTKGQVIIVFGATGDRDKSKRPIMGKIAAKNADLVYLTDDETYAEDPDAIRQAVYEGIVAAGGEAKTKIVDERGEAIKKAFGEAKKGDTVVLTGIGHQKDRNMGGKLEPWDEIAAARQILRVQLKR